MKEMAKKQDMMSMLRQTADNRKAELSDTKKVINQGGIKRGRPARYTEDDPKSSMTLVIRESSKAQVKKYAIDHGTTVSDLFMEWIQEKCEG